ncbi:hypothetical protein JCGZ_09662 [Jatropha curcas]|uniref:SAM domain-containing protein n=1 Tax=Jatropha curcas TaxID=180498 RepID=A0A067LDU1_JATCU|nr:uncharacterized protein LOC105642165 isoform X2 [Jatropha curcas]KDP45413.1 hypothetical protein JCGZ_09662 [Jatropha curcas]
MSSPEVTITLGRSGQVVTKGGKRSRGEGFGSNGDSNLFSANKRNRGDGMKQGIVLNGVNGSRIAKNDLRLKLMRKRLSKKIQKEKKETDPHKKLVKVIHPPMSSVSSYMLPDGSEPSGSNFLRQIHHREIADDLHQVDSLGKYYSYHPMGGSRTRSSDRILNSYNRSSPPRNFDEMRKVMPVRIADDSRGRRVLSDEILDSSRLASSQPLLIKAASQTGNVGTRMAPTRGIMQTVSHMGEEPQTVSGFLHSLGLGKYVVNFQAEEVDMTVLTQMGDKDLKEMGIPMGPRKKILLALLALLKRRTS